MKAKKFFALLIVLALFVLSGCLDIKIPNFKKTSEPSSTTAENNTEPTESPEPTDNTPEPTETPVNSDYTIDDIVNLFNSEMYGDDENYTVVTEERIKERIVSSQMQQNIDATITTDFTYQTDDEGNVTMKADAESSINGTTTQGISYYYDGYCYESVFGYKYKYVCTEDEFITAYFSMAAEEGDEDDVCKPEYIKSFSVEKDGRYTVIVVNFNQEAFFDDIEDFSYEELDELTTVMKIYLTEDDEIQFVESIVTGKGETDGDKIELNVTIKVEVVDFKPFELPTDLSSYEEEDFEDITEFI